MANRRGTPPPTVCSVYKHQGRAVQDGNCLYPARHSRVANDFVRGELGLEMLSSRREKLRLGYWWRIWRPTNSGRALYHVALNRRMELMSPRAGNGEYSWMRGTRDLLFARGLRKYWFRHLLCTRSPAKGWKAMVYKRVEQHFDEDRETRMEGFTSLAHYINIKWWGVTKSCLLRRGGQAGGPHLRKIPGRHQRAPWVPFEGPLQSWLPTDPGPHSA